MLIPSWAEEEVIRSEPWVSSRQLPNSGRTFWPLSFPPQMKVDRPCFLRWLLPPVSHFSESLLHQPIPVSWALILVLSLQSDPPSPGLRYLLLFSSLPQSGLDFASLVLSTLQSGFCSDHASLETPCKEIVNGLSRTKRLPWRSGGCGPPTVKPTLCAPGAVLLPLSLSWGHFFFRLSSLTTNSCVSQAFSPFPFFQFPFSSLDSYRRFPSSPQSQPPLQVWLPPTPSTRVSSCASAPGLAEASARGHAPSQPVHACFGPSPWVNFILKTLPDFGYFLSYSHLLHLSSELPTPLGVALNGAGIIWHSPLKNLSWFPTTLKPLSVLAQTDHMGSWPDLSKLTSPVLLRPFPEFHSQRTSHCHPDTSCSPPDCSFWLKYFPFLLYLENSQYDPTHMTKF